MMYNSTIVYPSSQIDSTLPSYIVEQYSRFVEFMTSAKESEERLGFSQDLLQNLQNYRDFDTYQKGVIKFGILSQNISKESEELTLENGYGFPDKNGILYVDNEIILYRIKNGNRFLDLKRGSAGTTSLPTFVSSGNYLETCPDEHVTGTKVWNLSVLFLSSMLETIYESFADGIDPSKIHDGINQSSLLAHIRDFFQSKGTRLGIKSLFKMMFGDNGTDVKYPGDQIIIPSVSSYSEDLTCRVVPIPIHFYETNEIPETPGVLIGSRIRCKSYNDDVIYGECVVEYTKSYPYDQTIQYDLLISNESVVGEIKVNPSTFIIHDLQTTANQITVDSTNGFPDSGIIFIGNEAIKYSSKTATNFLGCIRGYLGPARFHEENTSVFGPYYIQGEHSFQQPLSTNKCDKTKENVVTSRSWVVGLITDVNVSDSGILHTKLDKVGIKDPLTDLIRSDIELEVADVSTGNISDIFIQDPGPKTSAVGDFLFFDDTDTFGAGASAKVSWVHGEDVESSTGCEIVTNLISHRQQINLSSYQNSDKFVFTVGQFIETKGSNSLAKAIVSSWDIGSRILVVQTISSNLILAGDTITDERGNDIIIAPDYVGAIHAEANIFRAGTQREPSNLTMLDYRKPTKRLNGDPLSEGDLWWSLQNGRLYIFYNGYWVTTQPYGSSQFGVYLPDAPVGVSGIDFVATGNPPTKSQIIIADEYPTSNPDGSELRIGDLWWSSTTGLLYVWNSDRALGGGCITSRCSSNGTSQSSEEWVCTDPNGALSWAQSEPEDQPPGAGFTPSNAVSYDAKVIISNIPPVGKPNGTLWWSSERGRLFIRYQDNWVITNPFGSESGSQSYYPDGTLDNSNLTNFIGSGVNAFGESETQKELFFKDLCHFYPGDRISIDTETDVIVLERNKNSLVVQRGPNSIPLPDDALTRNLSRWKLTVQTSEPHRLQIGDSVRFHSPITDFENKIFTVIDVGKIIPASGTVTVDEGVITSVEITYGGENYDGDFYVDFNGGNGGGALAIARVQNGSVISVDVVSGGKNYSTAPTVSFDFERSVYFFTVYTDQWYINPNISYYETNSLAVQNFVTDIDLISGGTGYLSLPIVSGIYKREIDRASFLVELNGTSIDSITILNGGSRYVNPRAIVIDPNGKGTGAEISLVVNDGVITGVDINHAGIDYENPYIVVVEDGKFLAETTNIGKILSFNIIKEGRGVDSNTLRSPNINVETRLLLEYELNQLSTPSWTNGDVVYSGDSTGIVSNWDPARQLLSLVDINGPFQIGGSVRDGRGNIATIRISGQSSQNLIVSGISRLNGKFINDKSILNSNISRVQDGKYYQLFSYVIESSKPRIQYQNLVNDIIHPAGFVYFSETKIEDSVITQNRVSEPLIAINSNFVSPIVFTNETHPPINPRVGNLWFNSDTGSTYIYYGDRESGQTYWVDVADRLYEEPAD